MFKSLSLTLVYIVSCAATLGGCTDQKSATSSTEQQLGQPQTPAITVIKWGPQGTTAGKGFSLQSNGNSAIWFEARGIGNAEMVEIWFADKKLSGMAIVPDAGGSAEVPATLISTPGKYPVYLVIKPEGKRVDLGIFEVAAN